jgi:hypothetical protein
MSCHVAGMLQKEPQNRFSQRVSPDTISLFLLAELVEMMVDHDVYRLKKCISTYAATAAHS